MKKLILFLFFISFQGLLLAQNCEPTKLYTIATQSGLKLREGPGATFPVVAYVPAKSEVLVCEQLDEAATIENIAGHWRRVKFKDKYGFLFDGFLAYVAVNDTTAPWVEVVTDENLPITPPTANPKQSKKERLQNFKMSELSAINKILANDYKKIDSTLRFLNAVASEQGYELLVGKPKTDIDSLFASAAAKAKPAAETKEVVAPKSAIDLKIVTETFNYCGDIRALDPGKIWYAIYRDGDNFKMQRTELLILKSKYSVGKGLEFDIRAEGENENAFLICASKLLNTDWQVNLPFDYFVSNPKKLFPGQRTEIYANVPVANIHNVTLFATGEVTEVGLCPVMKNYKIQVVGEMHDKLITQDLTPFMPNLGTCGMPEIYWFGDINQDEYPDIIFVASGEFGTHFYLILSDTANTSVLYKKADSWSNNPCE